MKQRYLIVEHPVEHDSTSVRPDIHKFIGGYHWVRLDEEHIFMTAHIHDINEHHVNGHAKATVLPSLYSQKSVHKHLKDKGKTKHLSAIQKHGTQDNHTMYDVAEHFTEKFKIHSFSPDK